MLHGWMKCGTHIWHSDIYSWVASKILYYWKPHKLSYLMMYTLKEAVGHKVLCKNSQSNFPVIARELSQQLQRSTLVYNNSIEYMIRILQ